MTMTGTFGFCARADFSAQDSSSFRFRVTTTILALLAKS